MIAAGEEGKEDDGRKEAHPAHSAYMDGMGLATDHGSETSPAKWV
jgi:hypothetical protein